MSYMVLGFAVLIALVLFGRWFAEADVQSAKKAVKWAVLILGGLVLVLLLASGRGVWLIALAPALLGWFMRIRAAAGRAKAFARMAQGMSGGGGAPTGQKSEVRTRFLRAELDHDTGAMNAEVIEGTYAGSRLQDLGLDALLDLYATCRRSDPQSAHILEAYLDREHVNWRDGESEPQGSRRAGSGTHMSRAEALEVLDLDESADHKAIKEAYHRLMANHHPDRGGSTYLATKINEAKDVLLGN